jgi:hypothetical protein
MTKPLTDPELDYLLSFVGYGNLDADVWFLGMVEAGGGELQHIIREIQSLPLSECLFLCCSRI